MASGIKVPVNQEPEIIWPEDDWCNCWKMTVEAGGIDAGLTSLPTARDRWRNPGGVTFGFHRRRCDQIDEMVVAGKIAGGKFIAVARHSCEGRRKRGVAGCLRIRSSRHD